MTRILFAAMLGLMLSACAPQQLRPGAVHDRIGEEIKQAASERKAGDAADKVLMPPLVVEMPKVADTEPRFDLSVVNASAAQVFMAIVTGTRYNMLVTPEVSGQITVSLKDVTVRDALEAIRELYGYEFTVKGNRITIQPNTLRTHVFQVNYLASHRLGASELRVTSSAIAGTGAGTGTTSTPGGTATPAQGSGVTGQGSVSSVLTSRVQTTTDADFWGSLSTALAAIVGGADGRKVVVNPQSGVIVVHALPREIRQVEAYLRTTQAIVDRQVMLEAKILDVALNRQFQTGINWTAFRSGANTHSGVGVLTPGTSLVAAAPGSSGGTTPQPLVNPNVGILPGRYGEAVATELGQGFIGLALQTKNFAALLSFLETQGAVTVLSSPRIATINNQKAVLKVGTDELFVTNVTTTTTTSTSGGNTSTPTLTLQPYFSGISLDVTPQIDQENNIVLHIHPAVSDVKETVKVIDLGDMGQYKLPLASSSVNETDSIVRVRDGNIVAIGGLMSQSQSHDRSQLPAAGDIPLLGSLFGQRANSLSKRELVILLKPTVIQQDGNWVRDIEQTGERMRDMDPRQLIRWDQ